MSKCSLSIGKAVAWRRLYHIKVNLVGRPHFAHLRTLPECWHPLDAVQDNLHISMLKC